MIAPDHAIREGSPRKNPAGPYLVEMDVAACAGSAGQTAGEIIPHGPSYIYIFCRFACLSSRSWFTRPGSLPTTFELPSPCATLERTTSAG